ncbi:hypothetical protein [Rubritalea tangerina]|uniref:hypothetical protein n=1 Tax=Rubritalea tangerina TaxID=430798 RepID=UPI003620A9CB
MRPIDTKNFARFPERELEWLEQLDSYVSKLPAAYDSLKANVLYHRLQASANQDTYTKTSFFATSTSLALIPQYGEKEPPNSPPSTPANHSMTGQSSLPSDPNSHSLSAT